MSIMAATSVESDFEKGTAENLSVSSQELPVNPEVEDSEAMAVPIYSTHLEIPEVNVPITAETEPESRSTDSISEDNVSITEVEDRHALLTSESREAVDIDLNDDSIFLAAAEPVPEVVEEVAVPVLETSELQAEHSVEETTEVSFIPSAESLVDCNKIIKEVHINEVASETQFIDPNEGQSWSAMEVHSNFQLESTVEPVIVQLENPEARECDRTAEVEPQIIPTIMEESPVQIEEDRSVLAVVQVRKLLLSSYLLTVNP